MSNPQGGVQLTIRSYYDRTGKLTTDLHTYRIKSTAISVLSTKSPKADFSGKANVAEIVNGSEQSIEGNCLMQLYLHDGNATSSTLDADSLAVTVFRSKGGVWYSNNWPAYASSTVPAAVCNGDVNVTGSGAATQSVTSTSIVDESIRFENDLENGTFKVKAYPNPSTQYFTLDVLSNSNEPIEVKVFDMNGHMVYYHKGSLKEEHHKFGQMLTDGTYILNVNQGNKRQITTLIKK
jgi:FlaG/FlaF family flagellin (archaellin)